MLIKYPNIIQSKEKPTSYTSRKFIVLLTTNIFIFLLLNIFSTKIEEVNLVRNG